MPRRTRARATNVDQLGLGLRGEGFEGPLEARGVFSTAYLTRHLRNAQEFASEHDIAEVFREVGEIWRARVTALSRPNSNEAFTCSELLEPILDRLGWRRIPQQSMPGGFATRKVPDYCLFTSEADFTSASEADADTLFRLSATVVEAKRYLHPLDRVSQRETPGWFPSQQIQDYLSYAKDAAGRRFFNWAILTNGAEWRLYTDRSIVGAYFAFHLVRNGEFCSLEEFRTFFTLFRAAAFERNADGSCFLDSVREQSLRLQADLETNLRRRIFSVLEDVGTAFVDFGDNHLTEADFADVYSNALAFLYRLLFVLYAESRGLLPVKSYGPGANRRYLNEFSLARLIERLRDRTLYADDAFTTLCDELHRLFQLINGTHPRQNESLGVTRYNGGLFNPELHPRLEQWRIGDRALADILRQLIFAQPPARQRQRQGQLSTDEAIDYSTLEVRQLGDIYEGLLGAHFERESGHLELRNQSGKNHREGIYYTPDWVVQFLIRETLTPQLAQIEQTSDVQRALAAGSEEGRRNNSFAFGILRLNIVDPAMGSGHFLVRATEWLANMIMQHPTTRPMTEQIVAHGPRRVARGEIIARGKVPVSPGISQEQSEVAYWRRRVVEACIYGVDINPMAVELAKLSLWLTCIAAEEPLNFLDHHLREGNALLYVEPDALRRAPVVAVEGEAQTFEMGDNLHAVLAAVIQQTMNIEGEASTEMEVVKRKERQWREARQQLQPFLDLADLWLSASDGLPIDEINYLLAARSLITPAELDAGERREAQRFLQATAEGLAGKKRTLFPFHWHLEFPDVFYGEDGQPIPAGGFDAVLGNPPYISTQTSSAAGWRAALDRRATYLDDLYVHFTDLGFYLLKDGGGFGFIVADTFFTLASKLRMRALLQSHAINWLGQCDPFDATVDAAVFVARKEEPVRDARLSFVQARPLERADGSRTNPDKKLPTLPQVNAIAWNAPSSAISPSLSVQHAMVDDLRVHDVPHSIYITAHKRVFFEPRDSTLALFARFNESLKRLVEDWWEKIETSEKFAQNRATITTYQRTLRPGAITLVGLIAEGGQGLATGNNGRFLGYLKGSPQADAIGRKRLEWTSRWLADAEVGARFRELLIAAGGDVNSPTADVAGWEATVEPLRAEFSAARLGFSRMDLYRVARESLIATKEDFEFAWDQRKRELWERWRARGELNGFWQDEPAATISDAEFCNVCSELRAWVRAENASRHSNNLPPLPADVLGMRSAENYTDPSDAPRIATIYSGLRGRGQWVPYSKGDREGNRWASDQPLFIEWTSAAVDILQTDPRARWQNHQFFFLPGVSWSDTGNHVALKARELPVSVNDVKSMRLTPVVSFLSARAFLALLNADIVSFLEKKFVNNTAMYQVNDLRQIPIIIPTTVQHERLDELARLCIDAKRAEFSSSTPSNELVIRTRAIAEEMRHGAPTYLHPNAQDFLLATPQHCLALLGSAVNWEAEKLYGVQGLGPFDEF